MEVHWNLISNLRLDEDLVDPTVLRWGGGGLEKDWPGCGTNQWQGSFSFIALLCLCDLF